MLPSRPVRFLHRDRVRELPEVAPDQMLLEWLRGEGRCGTREGCAEGDCGACTVVVGELHQDGARLRAVNSCIRPLSSLDGCALYTVEDLAQPDGRLHPAQQAMLDHHGSQCGFCTPGFVMSLHALYHEAGADAPAGCIDRERAQIALSGNLCRCTGYRPILEAACDMHRHPPAPIDREALAQSLRALREEAGGCFTGAQGTVWRPATLAQALHCRSAAPDALVVAGATDVGLWINKQFRRPSSMIDLGGIRDFGRIRREADALHLGAGARLTDAFEAIAGVWPELLPFLQRFAGQPIRNAATLGGNIVNGSPIGDSMPLLLALEATLVLQSLRGSRSLPLSAFYTGYRRNQLAADELLTEVVIPAIAQPRVLRAWKLSKRFEDDISAVCLALSLQRDEGRIRNIRIGLGGMAATVVRAHRTEALLEGAPWSLASLQAAAACLREEFSPISDMRASAQYRRAAAGNLLLRLWHDQEGDAPDLFALRPVASPVPRAGAR